MPEQAPGALIAGKFRVESVVLDSQTTTTYACSSTAGRHFVKVLRSIVADDREDRGRFEREYKVLQKLNHPCIATVQGLVQTEKGVPCIVMEYLEGETLRAILQRGPLDVKVAVTLLMHLLSALQMAHTQGVVHRDLEPGNLFVVQRPDGKWHLKILNFGAARTSDAGKAPGGALTQAGTTIGSPDYMSPEQARGDQVDGRSDLYSAGCLAYAMLTGDSPFAGSGPQVMLRHLTEVPSPTRTRRRDVPPELDKWVMRALAKHPDDRFRDAQAARESLHAIMTTTPALRDAPRATMPPGAGPSGEFAKYTPAPQGMSPSGIRGTPVSGTPIAMPGRGTPVQGMPAPTPAGGGSNTPRPSTQLVVAERELQWKQGPGWFPTGGRMAILEGDPAQAGPFTVRVRLPQGARLDPHSHNRIERVTVLSGAIQIGEGHRPEATPTRKLGPGSYYVTPPDSVHFMWTDDVTVIQVSSMGPWEARFVAGK